MNTAVRARPERMVGSSSLWHLFAARTPPSEYWGNRPAQESGPR